MLLILFAIVQLFFSLFSLSMVIYLSIRFKKKAWDSPAKRFSNILNVFITSTIFIVAIYNFCIVPLIISPHCVASSIDLGPIFYISISFPHISFLYLTAICVSLLLQIVSPFLHEKLKQCTHKTHCTIFTEVVCHILIFIVLTTLLYGFAKFKYPFHIDPEIGIFSMLFVLVFSSFLIFAFVVFLMKFFRNQNIALSIKYMIIKLIFILIIYITFNIASIFISIEIDSFSFWSIVFYFNVEVLIYFIFSILVVSLNHPIWWCCRRSPDRAPLLPVNDTEGQQTNPISVWDHRNVPSYTVTNLPYDMSDCRSDYEQLP